MLNLTRITGTLDVGRLGRALAAPGMDPRTWFSYAIITAVSDSDAEGVIVDVTLMPSGNTTSARVASGYAGPGFGASVPLEVDDEVVIAYPSGDPMHGAVVIGRVNSASDPFPQDAIDNPTDVVLVIKPGQSIRLNVSSSDDGIGKAYVGSTNATDAAVLGTTYRNAEDSYFAALESLISFIVAFPALAVYFAPPISPAPPSPQFVALTAWTDAISAFHAAATSFLSQKVNIG